MRIAVTGACGFLMSVFICRLLRAHDDARALAIDRTRPDALWWSHLQEVRTRVEFHQADIRDPSTVADLLRSRATEVVVHGASITHVPQGERGDPVRFVDINAMGTGRLLDAARQIRSVRRFVHVSSAAVYGAGSGFATPQSERTPVAPDTMYGVSKAAGELVARRFAALYGLEVPIVRPSRVFGPMERPGTSRADMSLPFHLAGSRVANAPIRVTPRTLQACGDWISATDVADALLRLVMAPAVASREYNIALGRMVTVAELVKIFGAEAGTMTGPDAFDMDPALRSGRHGTYRTSRIARDVGWRARDLAVQANEYIEWARKHPATFTAHPGGRRLP